MRTEEIKAQLPFVIDQITLDGFDKHYQGKVRDSFLKGDKRILVTSDRLSCFDVCVTTVPFKGQVLQALTVESFNNCLDITEHYIIDVPHPNVIVGYNCEIVPFEVVVRGYLAGSAWRSYKKNHTVSGVVLEAGLNEFAKLPEPILTPSTKAPRGEHDTPISEDEIIKSGKIDARIWSQIHEKAIALFKRGGELASKQGLVLADTKYEFGLYKGKLLLADEIHTLDSSRYWVKESLNNAKEGFPPDMLDKEPTRRWLLEQGFSGEGKIPHFTDEHRIDIAKHYISSYQQISGREFKGVVGEVKEGIRKALISYI